LAYAAEVLSFPATHVRRTPGFGQQGRWQRRSKRDDWSLWYSRVGTAWSWSVGSCLGL